MCDTREKKIFPIGSKSPVPPFLSPLFTPPNPISKIKSSGRYLVFSMGEKWGKKQIKKVTPLGPLRAFLFLSCLDDSHLTRWLRNVER